MNLTRKIAFVSFACFWTLAAQSKTIVIGTVIEKNTAEPIIGATAIIKDENKAAVTDIDGTFIIPVTTGKDHIIDVNMLSYRPESNKFYAKGDTVRLKIEMESDIAQLGEVVVKGTKRIRTEASTVEALKSSLSVASAVSGELIRQSSDKDASEVMKRVTGVTIMNDKFVVARGLSQRYNNVWVNGVSMPSSEPDTRSFSFDLIPSGQIDNIMVFKSPAPDLPADFSGGFVKLLTRDTPEVSPFNISLTIGYNTETTFRKLRYNPGSGTDWLGLDNGHRNFKGGIHGVFDNADKSEVDRLSRFGFNNDWSIKSKPALPDLKFSASFGKEWWLATGDRLTLNAALNYSYSSLRYADMENARYGRYNIADDRPEYLYDYTDNRYQTSARWGAMLNLSWSHARSKFHFRNIFNQIGQDRLTERTGWQNISSRYDQEKTEYLYNSRSTYVGQFAGKTDFDNGGINWTAAYTYANRNQPDRRIINRQQNDLYGDKHFGEMQIEQNSIERDFTKLHEHVVSAGIDYHLDFKINGLTQTFKAGMFGQFRNREYNQRAFFYRFNGGNLPEDFSYRDVIGEILIPDNYVADKLYLYDGTDNRDSYSGHELQSNAYAALNMNFNRFDVYAGVRLEQSNMTLRSFTTISGKQTEDRTYNYLNLFPSVNASYSINPENKLRLAYGMTTNRPEFREISPSVYYDFELFSDIKGNPNLKAAIVNNVDLRWEWYPSADEAISVGAFYKHFRNPIENTFLDAGGGYTYTFENASHANVYGIEVDIRKNLGFIGMPFLRLGFNGALIGSRVNFAENSLEHNRPMQGQSPYIINASLFYKSDGRPFSAGILYNRIGKRIVGIGRTDISSGGTIDNDIPDMYEMSRNVLDLVVSYSFAKRFELKLSARDILGEPVEFCQFPKFTASDGHTESRKQITRKYNPGRSFQLILSIKL